MSLILKIQNKYVIIQMKNHIKNGGSVLVYPEGTAHAIGGPNTFYPGSFEVSFENNILIHLVKIYLILLKNLIS